MVNLLPTIFLKSANIFLLQIAIILLKNRIICALNAVKKIDMNKCNHEQKHIRYEWQKNFISGEMEYVRVEGTRSTYEDIDLHRYKCTLCGEVGYYSKAASDFYTKGIKSTIRGLI